MAIFAWTAQGTNGSTNTTIGATDVVRFSGAAAVNTTNVTVNSYQDGTHIENSGGTDICSTGIHIHNVKYLTATTMSLDGAGSANLSTLTTAQASLKINFSDAASVVTTGAKFYAYDGSTTTVAPTGVTFYAAEAAVTSTWVAAGGSAAALSIADDTTATSHDYFIAVSATPTSVGEKTAFKLRIELTYS